MIEPDPSDRARRPGRDRRRDRPRDALEEARIRFLGRKAELPNLLRGVAQLPPEERAATGKAANQARQELEAAIERRPQSSGRAELDVRLAEDRVDVTLPGRPAAARPGGCT